MRRKLTLEDCGSANVTFLNDERVLTLIQLRDGDRISIVLTGWWLFCYIWPLVFIFTGVAVIAIGFINPRSDQKNDAPSTPSE